MERFATVHVGHGRFTRYLVEAVSGFPNYLTGGSPVQVQELYEHLHSGLGHQSREATEPKLFLIVKVFGDEAGALAAGESDRQNRADIGPSSQPRKAYPANSSVPTILDNAATIDQLNRRPFARILARRIWELHERREAQRRKAEQDKSQEKDAELEGAYIIHLNGRWGEGKSTVLNFLRKELRPMDDPTGWVVVDFNAWRTQSTRPPWWTLVREIHRQAKEQVPYKFKMGIWWHWVAWHWAMAAGPWLLAASVMVGVAYLLKGLGTATELIAGVVAGAITLATLGRSLFFGSSKAAETFMDHRKDATRPVKERYTKLISAIHQPVIVFVDDVDRCDKSYVVELLEGIQTLFRDAPVTFLIAADRKWICRSFEKHYDDFNNTVGDPARPLGYLFLEKLFQLSVTLPTMSLGQQREFMKALLQRNADPAKTEEIIEKAEQDAEKQLDTTATDSDVKKLIDEAPDAFQKQAIQRASAKRLASTKYDKARQHELEPFAHLLEPNPRAMKRLLNAYGLRQSMNRLEDRRPPLEEMVRWVIVELRWPLFAEHAGNDPEVVELVGPDVADGTNGGEGAKERDERIKQLPAHVSGLLADPHLTHVIGVNANGGRIITKEVLLGLVGTLPDTTAQPNSPQVDLQPNTPATNA